MFNWCLPLTNTLTSHMVKVALRFCILITCALFVELTGASIQYEDVPLLGSPAKIGVIGSAVVRLRETFNGLHWQVSSSKRQLHNQVQLVDTLNTTSTHHNTIWQRITVYAFYDNFFSIELVSIFHSLVLFKLLSIELQINCACIEVVLLRISLKH